jgi:hypothetical protein
MSKQYFLATAEGAQKGPYKIEELEALHITPATLVWCDGMTKWEIAEQIEELSAILKAPAPPPVPIDHTIIPQISIAAPVLATVYQPTKITTKDDYTYIYIAVAGILFLLLIIFFVSFALPDEKPNDLAETETPTNTENKSDYSEPYTEPYSEPYQEENNYSAPSPAKNTAAEQQAKAEKAAQRANEKAERERQKAADKDAALREQLKINQQYEQQQQDERNRERQQRANIANNIKSYLTADCSYNADKILGGISNGTINIYNNSGYFIDRAAYQISYWQRNGDLYKMEEVYTDNINTKAYISLPNSQRGIKITIKLVMVQSNALNLLKYY